MFFLWFSVCCAVWVISIILSSRSLMHSFALSNLLFIACSSVCISANEYSSFSWLLLIFSSSFLRESALLFISSCNSFSIFTISLLNSKCVRLQSSVSLFTALGEFSYCFNWEWFLSFFILLVIFFFVVEVHSLWPGGSCPGAAAECFPRAGGVSRPLCGSKAFPKGGRG